MIQVEGIFTEGGGSPSLQSKSVTYTANGTNTITPDAGYDGLSSVDVTVNVDAASGGGIIDSLSIYSGNFVCAATNILFRNCEFAKDSYIDFNSISRNVLFVNCYFENSTIQCTQSIRDAIENGVGNQVYDVQFVII